MPVPPAPSHLARHWPLLRPRPRLLLRRRPPRALPPAPWPPRPAGSWPAQSPVDGNMKGGQHVGAASSRYRQAGVWKHTLHNRPVLWQVQPQAAANSPSTQAYARLQLLSNKHTKQHSLAAPSHHSKPPMVAPACLPLPRRRCCRPPLLPPCAPGCTPAQSGSPGELGGREPMWVRASRRKAALEGSTTEGTICNPPWCLD